MTRRNTTLLDGWARVRRECDAWRVDAFLVVGTAKATGVSPDEVLARFEAAQQWYTERLCDSILIETPPVDEPTSLWPGFFDARLLFQGLVWLDEVRSRHEIVGMDDDALLGVIHRLMVNAQSILDTHLARRSVVAPRLRDRPGSVWMESTPLMRALRREARSRGLVPAEPA